MKLSVWYINQTLCEYLFFKYIAIANMIITKREKLWCFDITLTIQHMQPEVLIRHNNYYKFQRTY